MIAFRIYGSTSYWQVVLLYNCVVSVGDLVPGLVLNYPSLTSLEGLLLLRIGKKLPVAEILLEVDDDIRYGGDTPFSQLHWPTIGSGVPSQLLSRRPDIASAEARLVAASADITVARAAMLPSLTLSASIGSGADHFSDILRSPFYNLGAGLAAPIFNNGRLSAERDKATARQQELLQSYRGSIINAFADVEKALNSISGLDRQRQWQDEELTQAQLAFDIAQQRYSVGADLLLTVLQTQRTLYQAQDLHVQLRMARLQASIALYKALGGGWSATAGD